MVKTLKEIKVLKNAIQEVYTFLYWEVPAIHYEKYDKIVILMMKRLEEIEKEYRSTHLIYCNDLTCSICYVQERLKT